MLDEIDQFIINNCIRGVALEKIMETIGTNEEAFNKRLEKAVYELVDNDILSHGPYYSAQLENYLYMLFLAMKKRPMLSLIDLFEITIPNFEITTSINVLYLILDISRFAVSQKPFIGLPFNF